MSTKDFLEKDYYKVLGVTKTAASGARRSRSRTASSPVSTTPTPTRVTLGRRIGSRRYPRPTTRCPTASAARSTTTRAPCSVAGSGAPARAPRAAGDSTSTSATCLAPARPAAMRAAGSGTSSAACSAAAAAGRVPRRTGRGGALTWRRRPRCRSATRWKASRSASSWPSEGPRPTCKGTGAKASRRYPRVCPSLRRMRPGARTWAVSPSPSRATSAAAAVWWSTTCSARRARAAGAAIEHPDHPGAHPGRLARRPADQAEGQGSASRGAAAAWPGTFRMCACTSLRRIRVFRPAPGTYLHGHRAGDVP